MIKWGLGGIVFLIGVSMLKLFAWMQMDKNALLREIKRLEIQVSSLSQKCLNNILFQMLIFSKFAIPRDDFSPTLNFRFFERIKVE